MHHAGGLQLYTVPHAVMGSFACFSQSAAGERVLQSALWAEAGSMLCGTKAAYPVQQRSPHCLLFAGVRGATCPHRGTLLLDWQPAVQSLVGHLGHEHCCNPC